MRTLLAATLLASAAASAVIAQDATTPAPAAEAKSYDADTVLATVNGDAITLGHVIALRDRLPPQYQELPDAVLMSGLVDQIVDQQLLAAAELASPDSDPLGVRLHLDNERRGALASIAADGGGRGRGRRRQGAGGLRQGDRRVRAGSRSSAPRTSSSTARRRRRR